MTIAPRKWRRPPGFGWPKWRGWRVVMDNFLLHQNTMLPRGYGVAWRKYDQDCTVVMPIPLNILASWGRYVWHWLRHGVRPVSVVDRMLSDAYQRGLSAASNNHLSHVERVREMAYEKGVGDGHRETLKVLDYIREDVRELRSELEDERSI